MGKPELVADALTMVKHGGVLQLVGVNPKEAACRSTSGTCTSARSGSTGPSAAAPPIRERSASCPGSASSRLVTKRFPLDRIEDAFTHAAAGRGVKTMITPAAG